MRAPEPENEAERLQELWAMEILDTAAEKSFDDLTRLATYICKTPMAAITLVDSERQWFKSRIAISPQETARDISFCAHAILQNRTLLVPDALADDRFCDNPFVTGEPHVRFYAGSPLTTVAGYRLGALCVIDTVPRELSDGQRAALRALGRQITSQMELRREINSLRSTLKELEGSVGENTQRFTISNTTG